MFPTRLNYRAIAGGFAGFAATLPMSVFLIVAQRFLPWHEQYPLPPFGEITNSLANKVGLSETKGTPPHKALTAVSHFSYGTAAGSVYASMAPRTSLPAWFSGLLYGLGVWFVSYMGWLPAFRVLPPANKQPRERTIIMIIAHAIWGVATGLLVNALVGRRRK